jgi:iron complex outermembrane recepter protein
LLVADYPPEDLVLKPAFESARVDKERVRRFERHNFATNGSNYFPLGGSERHRGPGGEHALNIAKRKPVMALLAAPLLIYAGGAAAQSLEQLRSLSLDELANVEITSVSKTPEPLSDAPAAVYVITHDEIMRSGATTLPEILRLAPNLEVAQINATSYAITARGFNVGNNASLSDKLLVLVDGRTVYTPLFAGVYWDMQGVPPEDIDRIEVISGPGSTLYGANAMNGVINIITRHSADTQGGYLEAGAGNLQRGGAVQYGGRVGKDLTYRAYLDGYQFSPTEQSNGADAEDAWSKPQGGFRIDWSPGNDSVTAEGDLFQADEEPGNRVQGADLVANWRHRFDGGSSLQVAGYYDLAKRFSELGGGGFAVNTYNFSVQHQFAPNSWNQIVWGAENRIIDYQVENTATLLFQPAARSLDLADLFVQDTIPITSSIKSVTGLKLENEPYTGIEPLPSERLSWKPTDNVLLWTAVSRAVRAATPVDRDLIEKIGSTPIISGSFDFQPETLTAYELGTRVQATPELSFSISGYYNDYDDLRTIEASPGTFLPLRWGNEMAGHTYGAEVWGSYRVTDWWRLGPAFNIQHESFHFKSGSSQIGGTAYTADDPSHQASLRSSIDIGPSVTWDAFLRYVGKLPNPAVPDYAELNMRLGWRVTPQLELSLSGFNLIHAHHQEFSEAGTTTEIPRSFLVDARLRF